MSAKQNLIDAIEAEAIDADIEQAFSVAKSGLLCVRLKNSDEIAISDGVGFWVVSRSDLVDIVEATK